MYALYEYVQFFAGVLEPGRGQGGVRDIMRYDNAVIWLTFPTMYIS